MPLESFVLFFAAGLMSFVALHHAASNFSRRAPQHAVFALMTLLAVPLAISQALMIQAATVAEYLNALH